MCFPLPVTAARLSDRQSVCVGRSCVDWLVSLTLSHTRPPIGWSEGRENRLPQWHLIRENWTLDPPPPFLSYTNTQNRGHTHISHILKGFGEAFHMITMVISREEHTCADTQMVHLMALLWLLIHMWPHQRIKHGSGLTKLGVSTTQVHQLISGLE